MGAGILGYGEREKMFSSRFCCSRILHRESVNLSVWAHPFPPLDPPTTPVSSGDQYFCFFSSACLSVSLVATLQTGPGSSSARSCQCPLERQECHGKRAKARLSLFTMGLGGGQRRSRKDGGVTKRVSLWRCLRAGKSLKSQLALSLSLFLL